MNDLKDRKYIKQMFCGGVSLKAVRVNAGLTQTQVAQLLGVTQKTVENWENGKTKVKQLHKKALCEIYNKPEGFINWPGEEE